MILLLRHGQSEHNVNSLRVAGQALNSPLTELGERQSKKVGLSLRDRSINQIYCSPAMRTADTAKIIAEQLFPKPTLTVDERLLEMDQGEYVGRYKLAIILNPLIFFRIILQGKDFSFEKGESFNQVAGRMQEFISGLNPDENVVVVTHGMAMRCLLGRRYGWSVWKIILKRIKNTEIVEWQ